MWDRMAVWNSKKTIIDRSIQRLWRIEQWNEKDHKTSIDQDGSFRSEIAQF